MNPHQKPQEDVVVTQEDIAEAEQWRFIEGRDSEYEGDFVTDLAAAFARHRLLGHEAGRRDMREAAGKVAMEHASHAEGLAEQNPTDVRIACGLYARKIVAGVINLPTEPLGGVGKP